MGIVLAYINEAFILISAILMAIGWVFIRRGNVRVHRALMLSGATSAVLFFVTYVVKTMVFGDTKFGGPSGWRAPYYTFLQTHTILATVAAILGIITIRFAFIRRFRKHRRVAPWTVVIWFITAASGLMVFLMLYIIFPSGSEANVLNALTGH